MLLAGTIDILHPICHSIIDTALYEGHGGGGNYIGGDGGGGSGRACDLPDGRTIPAGQHFNYVHRGISLMCICPKERKEGESTAPCKQANGGRHFDG